ncbi:MAG: SRPBCC family protein [Pseudomonadota bacterium]
MTLVTRTQTLAATPPEVWAAIGDFHALVDWHPAVIGSTREEDGAVRRLDLGGGAEIVERILGTDGMSYAYEILEGPLPVSNYRSILSAAESGEGTVLIWSSTFEPTADGAEQAIAGVYTSGFAALVEKFGS